MKKVFSNPRVKGILVGVFRYLLGINMMIYGLTKIMQTQFVILPISTWLKPLEELSGINLTWAFLGYSPWFTILLGLLEFIPGVLLLFRKTHYLGAILLLPVCLNVTLINYALDLWQGTKNISTVLLIFNLIILVSGLKSIVLPIVNRIWSYISVKNFFKLEIGVNLAVIGAVVFFFGRILVDYKNDTNFLTGDWFHKKNNVWTVQKVNPVNENENQILWWENDLLLFSPRKGLEYKSLTQNKVLNYSYILDESEQTLEIESKGLAILKANYKNQGDSLLILTPQNNTEGTQSEIRISKRVISRN